jgi:hypothetical protein
MNEIVITNHDACHAEIFHLATQCERAQDTLRCRRLRLSAEEQASLAASPIDSLEACRIASRIKQAHGVAPGALFLTIVNGNLQDDEDDEYFLVDAGASLPEAGPIGVLSLYYQNEASTFMRDGAGWWKALSAHERKRVFSDSVINNLLSAMTTGLLHRECHPESRGCIMDWCQAPTDLVAGLRGSFEYCREDCQPALAASPLGSALLATAERLSKNPFRVRPLAGGEFDVFLCHNSADKPAVRNIYQQLKERGIHAWFDEKELQPGSVWEQVIQTQLGSINKAAVFVGNQMPQRWHELEYHAILDEFVERKCQVIPVILPGTTENLTLPLFLREFTWVDFRTPQPDPMDRLIWAITGEKPPPH